MNLGGLRTLVRDLNFSAFGLAVSVNRALIDIEPIETTGIWLTPTTDDLPVGGDFRRRDVRYVMALKSTDIDSVPRGTFVMAPAPEDTSGPIRRWRIDGIDRVEGEHVRVVLVKDFELDP